MYENLLQLLVYRRIVTRVCTIHKKTNMFYKKYIKEA